MTVYADCLFLLNFIINYLLLLGSAYLGGAPAARGRLAAASALGSGYAVAAVVPGMTGLSCLLVKALVMAGMILLAFGWKRRSLQQGALFLGLSFAFGGVAMAVAQVMGSGLLLLNGAAYYSLSAKALVLTAGAAYAAAWLLFSRAAEHKGGDLVPVSARLGEKTVQFRALRDTGNTLRDPLTNQPVLVAEWQLLRELIPPEGRAAVSRETAARPAELFQQLRVLTPQVKCRLIPYRAVGVAGGLMLAVQCDAVQLGKRPAGRMLVAFSSTAVSDGGGYSALMGGIGA